MPEFYRRYNFEQICLNNKDMIEFTEYGFGSGFDMEKNIYLVQLFSAEIIDKENDYYD